MKKFLLAMIVAVVPASQAMACFTGGRAAENQTVDWFMHLKSGAGCGFVLSSLGPMEGVTLIKKPSVGTVDLAGHLLRYRAKAGYVGKDEFTITVRSRTMVNKPYVWSARVAVSVSQ